MKDFIVVLLALGMALTSYAQPKREFRGVWIATVANIDWPSEPGLPVAQQKEELSALIEFYYQLGFNAVVFQVRPASDAFYASELEPWSYWLTGTQGMAPEPFYDPLEFAIEECHQRGMELHAWLNPYRVLTDLKQAEKADSLHVSKQHPEWLVDYGNRRYFDPGLPETRAFYTKVVKDIVSRYEVDAIHMDDYFYPYRIEGEEFPDSASFAAYPRGFQANEKDDWRRDNVNTIIKMLYDTIQSVKPHVQLGVSPFGVWRNQDKDPKGSPTQAGQTNYDDLYADVLLWIKKGWVDYLVPQIYWHMGFELADFTKLSQWWNENHYGTNIYVGQGPYRIGSKRYKQWRKRREIPNQIDWLRGLENIQGSVFFSAKSLLSNPKRLNNLLQRKYFATQALPPVWSDEATAPEAPHLLWQKTERGRQMLCWEHHQQPGQRYVVYRFKGSKAGNLNEAEAIYRLTYGQTVPVSERWHLFARDYTFVVTTLDASGKESAPSAPITLQVK